ncbi:MAG: hypothetical protein D6820_07770, partial [Lentisphaerae bacterium]
DQVEGFKAWAFQVNVLRRYEFLDEAKTVAERGLEKFPESAELLSERIFLAVARGDNEGIDPLLQRLRETGNESLYYQTAIHVEDYRGNRERALGLAREWVDMRPYLPAARESLLLQTGLSNGPLEVIKLTKSWMEKYAEDGSIKSLLFHTLINSPLKQDREEAVAIARREAEKQRASIEDCYNYILCLLQSRNLSIGHRRKQIDQELDNYVVRLKKIAFHHELRWDAEARIAWARGEFRGLKEICRQAIRRYPLNRMFYQFFWEAIEKGPTRMDENRQFPDLWEDCQFIVKQLRPYPWLRSLFHEKLETVFGWFGKKKTAKLLHELWADDPESPAARLVLRVYLRTIDNNHPSILERAQKIVEEMLGSHEYLPDHVLANVAEIAYLRQDFEQARRYLLILIQRRPADVEYRIREINCLVREGTVNQEDIYQKLQDLCQLSPYESEIYSFAAFIYWNYFNDYERTKDVLYRGLARMPYDAGLRQLLNHYLLNLGEIERTQAECEQFIHDFPEIVEILPSYIIVLRHSHRLLPRERSIELLETAREKEPANLEITKILSEMYYEEGELRLAQSIWNRVGTSLSPPQSLFHELEWLQREAFSESRNDRANRILAKLRDLYPHLPNSWLESFAFFHATNQTEVMQEQLDKPPYSLFFSLPFYLDAIMASQIEFLLRQSPQSVASRLAKKREELQDRHPFDIDLQRHWINYALQGSRPSSHTTSSLERLMRHYPEQRELKFMKLYHDFQVFGEIDFVQLLELIFCANHQMPQEYSFLYFLLAYHELGKLELLLATVCEKLPEAPQIHGQFIPSLCQVILTLWNQTKFIFFRKLSTEKANQWLEELWDALPKREPFIPDLNSCLQTWLKLGMEKLVLPKMDELPGGMKFHPLLLTTYLQALLACEKREEVFQVASSAYKDEILSWPSYLMYCRMLLLSGKYEELSRICKRTEEYYFLGEHRLENLVLHLIATIELGGDEEILSILEKMGTIFEQQQQPENIDAELETSLQAAYYFTQLTHAREDEVIYYWISQILRVSNAPGNWHFKYLRHLLETRLKDLDLPFLLRLNIAFSMRGNK